MDEHKRLQDEVFPDLKVGLVHGRLKPAEKDEVMLKFRDREFDILVSTSVVEVGVDIPNATMMVIEGGLIVLAWRNCISSGGQSRTW